MTSGKKDKRLPSGMRAGLFSLQLGLAVFAYYQVKPASRALFVEHLGVGALPWVWIATALLLGVLVGLYHRAIRRYGRRRVVQVSGFGILLGLGLLHLGLATPGPVLALLCYVFADLFGLLMVEQIWARADSDFERGEGKRWFGMIGCGALTGGLVGSVSAALMLEQGLGTADLLPVAALALVPVLCLDWARREPFSTEDHFDVAGHGWRLLLQHRPLRLLAATLLLAQFAAPLIEYQFMQMVAVQYHGLDERTAYLARFFGVMSLVAIVVNLLLTPLIHRVLGATAGLFAQPLVLTAASLVFAAQPGAMPAAALKLCDRGLSWSINRSSRELLYLPFDPLVIHHAKAWIDVFGYRMVKIGGALLILLLTQGSPSSLPAVTLAWVVVACCVLWLGVVFRLGRRCKPS